MNNKFVERWVTPAIIKRLADYLEKVSAASLIWYVFQDASAGLAVAITGLLMSLYMTEKVNK